MINDMTFKACIDPGIGLSVYLVHDEGVAIAHQHDGYSQPLFARLLDYTQADVGPDDAVGQCNL